MKTHSKKDIFYYYRFLLYGLIPLILFGIFKNGYLLYKEYHLIYYLLKPIILLFVTIIVGLIIDRIKYGSFKPNKNLIILLLIYMILPINMSYILYLITYLVAIGLLYFDKEWFNVIALVKLLTIILYAIFSKYTYMNSLELTGNYLYSYMDLIFRYQVGGIATSNLILVVLITIYLLFNILYKKNIALFSLAIYLLIYVVACFIINPSTALVSMIRSSVIFELIVIAPFTQYSCYTQKGQIVFGLLVGFVGAAICFILPFEGVSIAILLLSCFSSIIDKFFVTDKKRHSSN